MSSRSDLCTGLSLSGPRVDDLIKKINGGVRISREEFVRNRRILLGGDQQQGDDDDEEDGQGEKMLM